MPSQADEYLKSSGIRRVGAENEAVYQAVLGELQQRYEEVKAERDHLAACLENMEANRDGWMEVARRFEAEVKSFRHG